MFKISSDIPKQQLRFSGRGMWDMRTQADFQDAFVKEAGKFVAVGLPFDIICDLSDYPPQQQEIAAGSPQLEEQLRQMGGRRAAIIVRNVITKLQVVRVAASTENMAFFSSEEDALVWLESASS